MNLQHINAHKIHIYVITVRPRLVVTSQAIVGKYYVSAVYPVGSRQ